MMSDLQKLSMRREDVDALEDAADTLMRRDYHDQATRLYALALRLRTEAGWTVRLSDTWSVQVGAADHRVRPSPPLPSNVRELRRGE